MRSSSPGINVSIARQKLLRLVASYLLPSISLPTTLGRSCNQTQVHTHQVLDMHPRPLVLSPGNVERTPDLHHLPYEHGKESTLLPPRPSARSIDIRRADDSSLELGSVLSRSCLDDGVDIAVQCISW